MSHMKVHNTETEQKNEQTYKCTLCQEEFDDEERFKSHVCVHNNVNVLYLNTANFVTMDLGNINM